MGKKKIKQESTWKNITQSVLRRTPTFSGFKRRFTWGLKLSRAFIFGFASLLILLGGIYIYHNNDWTHSFIASDHPVDQIELSTDGVLTDAWLRKKLGKLNGVALMDVDIYALKERIERTSQVSKAEVSKRFPGTLRVELKEHQPLLRIASRGKNKKIRTLVISSEGIVFAPVAYTRRAISHLPFIEGVSLKRSSQGFEPIAGVSDIAELLELSRDQKPYLYSGWKVVSLKRLDSNPSAPWSTIEVKTKSQGTVVFSSSDFAQQLERLDYIIQDAKDKRLGAIERIDLSLGDHASVQLANHRRRF